ncbi:MAG: alanine racemase [Flavobacteriaceae bacterium]
MSQATSNITETVLELDLNALGHNYRYLKSKIHPNTRMMAVVKAFGYGSDAVEVSKELVRFGIDYFAVAYAKEGETLRNHDVMLPILVLHPLPGNFETILHRCLEPNLYSLKILKEFIAFAEQHAQKAYPIHIKFNTGLNRLGFSEGDIETIAALLSETNSVKVASIFSHLAATEDPSEREFTLSQIEKFTQYSQKLITRLGYQPLRHTLNTSGILNYPEAQFNMVRTGIGLYGYGNDPHYDSFLKPIASLKTVISQIHEIPKGASLGYNRAFVASQNTRTATLPIGHADGISRIYGNGVGWVSILGKKAPIIGNVCMDMIMVDISGIDCKEGDEVLVFGPTHTADEMATSAKTISYELITAISQRIKRVIKRV